MELINPLCIFYGPIVLAQLYSIVCCLVQLVNQFLVADHIVVGNKMSRTLETALTARWKVANEEEIIFSPHT